MRLGIAGLGTVAQGLLALVRELGTHFDSRSDHALEVTRVASRSPRSEVDLLGATFDTRVDSLVSDDVDVVVELIGGTEAARQLVCGALEAGKPVVTANKALLAEHGDSIFELARSRGVSVGFEASVCGGVPIIHALHTSLAGTQIREIAGIVNGTCNFVLSTMEERDVSLASAASEALRLGVAEADPRFDIDGIDAGQKLSLLAALAFGLPIRSNAVRVEGISAVSREDVRLAGELGFRIRHIAQARCESEAIELGVHPALIKNDSTLAQVRGVLNAVALRTSALEKLVLLGPGAGGRATAAAVLSDLLEVARNRGKPPPIGRTRTLAITGMKTPSRFYVNVPALDRPGVMGQLGEIMSNHGVSLDAVLQKPADARTPRARTWVPVALLTSPITSSELATVLQELTPLTDPERSIRTIRVMDSEY